MKGLLKKHDITILYVEDEELIRTEIGSILGMLASNVVIGVDGGDGLEKFQANEIDLIITDVNMPVMTGFEMLKKIRDLNPEVPAIILSAFSQNEFLKEASTIDTINEYLLKPIDIKVLIEKINKAVKNINKKKDYEKVLKLLEQYKIAVDSSAIVSKADIKGNITYANEKFCEISGYTQEELIGKPHNMVRHPDTKKEIFEDLWNTILKKKEIWNGKIKNKAKNGKDYIVDATIVPILDIDGNIEEFIGLRNDITEVEAYKEILQKQLSNTETAVESKIHLISEYEKTINLSASVLRLDLNMNISFVNDRFCEVSKHKADDLESKDFEEIICPLVKGIDKEINKSIIDNNFWHGVVKCRNSQDNPFYMDFTFRAIKDIDDNIIEFMGIGKDITETIKLHEEIEDTQRDVIFTLGSIGEARSKETGNHVKRVAEYSYLLAKLHGLSEDEAELLKIASPMHDIGKVGIPDAILNKPAKFTPEEFEFMKNHTLIGYNMLKNSNRKILRASATVAYEHHEKWNGKGYPRGLSGEDIHIYGRITAIADVFDALGSDRCYKKAWELDRILGLFKEERGEHFDPNLIDLFMDNLDEFLKIRDTYSDSFVEDYEY